MWEKVAKEMGIPWRAAEAMHWQLGEHDMAQRANAPIFHLSSPFVAVSQTTPNTHAVTASTTAPMGQLQLPNLQAVPPPTPAPGPGAPPPPLASRSRGSSNASMRRKLEPGSSGQRGRYSHTGDDRTSPMPGDSHGLYAGKIESGSARMEDESSSMIYEPSDQRGLSELKVRNGKARHYPKEEE